MLEPLRRWPTLLASIPLLLVGCTTAPTEPAVVVWRATISSDAAALGPAGTLAALSEGINTRTTIRIEFGEAATRYGWRIRQGRCAPFGTGQVGGRAAYPDVVTTEAGTGTAAGTIAQRLLSSGRYHAVIVDPDDETRTLACGSLVPGVG
jgi:hypothetical protein